MQLKRFDLDHHQPRKNEAEVRPSPVELILNGTHVRYNVRGVICHQGSLSGGHYTYANSTDDDWRCYNDSTISDLIKPPTNGYIFILVRDIQ